MKARFLNQRPATQSQKTKQREKIEQQKQRRESKVDDKVGSKIIQDDAKHKRQISEEDTVLQRKTLEYHLKTFCNFKAEEIKFFLDEIAQHIYDVADRNEVYRANYIHLLIALGLTLKTLDINSDRQRQSYLKCVIKAIITKMKQRPQLRLQLANKQLYNQFMIVILNPNVSQTQIIQFLRKFLKENQEIMMAFLPYYYNFFALLVNKEIVFKGEKGELLEYTVDLKHERFYNGAFTRNNVYETIELMEKLLIDKYHSKDI